MALIFDRVELTDRIQLGNTNFQTNGTWTRHQTAHGYIDFGPANSSHAHIYTDRANFYLSKPITVNGSSIVNSNDIRASIFYDVDNTGYYINPASTSNLNALNVGGSPVLTAASGNVFVDGDLTLNMSNDDGLVYDDSSNIMYVRADGSNYAIIDSRGGTISGVLTMNGGGQKIALNNGDITGVNQITINDPGEGIVWTSGSSGNITLATIDDSSDNILNVSGTGATLAVNGATVLTTSTGITNSGNDTRTGNLLMYSTDTSGNYGQAAIELKEVNQVGTAQSAYAYAPAIAWHWGGRKQMQMRLHSDGHLYVDGSNYGQSKVWTAGNDGSGSGLDADKLDGIQLDSSSNTGSRSNVIPYIKSDSVMEIGKYIDFHDTSSTADYDIRLYSGSSNLNVVGGYLQVNGSNSVRASLFYDVDNTSYFINPSNRSELTSTNISLNDATGLSSGTFDVSKSVKGGIHFTNGSGTGASNGYQASITFMGSSSAESQAGIYVHNNNSTGTFMAFATTNSYNTGPQIGLKIDKDGKVFADRNFIQSNTDMRAPLFYDSNDTGYYLNPAGTTNLNTVNANTISISGNSNLGNGNGDVTRVNDILHVGASDSGNASIIFGEDSTNWYGAHLYWDSGYRFSWKTRNAGTDTDLFYYDTNDLSYIHWNRNHHLHNKALHYVSELHFQDNVRFYDNGDDSYLNYKYGDSDFGGIRFYNGSTSFKGAIYGSSGGFGLLDNDFNWAVRIKTGTSPLELSCDNNVEFQVFSSYTLSPGSSRAPIFYDSGNTAYYINGDGTSYLYTLDTNTIQSDQFKQLSDGVPRNNLGSPTVTEMALFDRQFGPKTTLANNYNDLSDLRFYKQDTSSSAWDEITTYSDDQKRRFLRTANSSVIIPYGVYKFRVEFKAPGYVYANAMYGYWSSQGHSTQIQVWKYNQNTSSWSQHTSATNTISSWPGHMYLPFATIPWHETNTTSTNHFSDIRFEFTPNWNASYSSNNIGLSGMEIWGGYPAGKRTPYSHDQNGSFLPWGNVNVNNGSVFAQVYYDSDDTNYFINPATSGRAAYLRGYAEIRTETPILKLNDYTATNTTDLNAWVSFQRDGTEAGYVGYGTSSNDYLYVHNGSGRIYLSSSFTHHSSSSRAPIFYDVDNTLNYIDPNSGGNSLSIAGNISMPSGKGIWLATSSDTNWQFGRNIVAATGENLTSNTIQLKVYGQNVQGFQIINHLGAAQHEFGGTGEAYFGASARAPIFYDSDNTSYYLNPAGVSNINELHGSGKEIFDATDDSYLRINQSASFSSGCWFGSSQILQGGDRYIAAGSNGGTTSSRVYIYGGTYTGTNIIKIDGNSGIIQTTTDSVRAPRFYDYDNTAYYVDPATTTQLNILNANSLDVNGNITANAYVSTDTSQSRAKFRLWNGSTSYSIGMNSGYTYGHLGDYAMAFQMNDDSDRGFWWGDTAHSNAQGAMSLTTTGQLTVASSVSIGESETVTSPSTLPLYVSGNSALHGLVSIGSNLVSSGTGLYLYYNNTTTGSEAMKITQTQYAGVHIRFIGQSGSQTGSIGYFGTSTTYNTSSDYRLKENVVPMTGAIDRVNQLKPSRFTWIGDPDAREVDGFIAHEVSEVVPEAITGVKDELDAEGNPLYQGIDQSKLVPLLTAALKEAIAKIEDLENRLQILENQ